MEYKPLKLGKYLHYKGKEYEAVGVAKFEETLEDMVVYKKLYDDYGLWVRTYANFTENVIIDGKEVPRFKYIGE